MSNRFARVVPIAHVLLAQGAVPASAATTRFASPGGVTTPSACTDAASPCSLPVALGSAQAGDTVSLGAGAYDFQAIALPQVPLHWVATNKGTRPLLSSAGPAATVFLTSGSSGSSFERLEIDNTSTGGVALGLTFRRLVKTWCEFCSAESGRRRAPRPAGSSPRATGARYRGLALLV